MASDEGALEGTGVLDHYSMLFEYCCAGCCKEEDIKAWVDTFKGSDLASKDEAGLTALHLAAKAGNASAARALLLAAGYNEERRRLLCLPAPPHHYHGATPLHLAAAHGVPVLQALLPELVAAGVASDTPTPATGPRSLPSSSATVPPALLGVLDDRRQTLLHYAAVSDNAATLDLLLPHFAASLGVDVRDAAGRTPLSCAVTAGAAAAAAALLRHGAGLVRTPPSQWSPFHHAAMYNRPDMLGLLFLQAERAAGGRRGALAELDAADAKERTPLHVAAEYGSTAAAERLLALGAAQDRRDVGGATSLHLAAARGWVDVVRLLATTLQQQSTISGAGSRSTVSGGSAALRPQPLASMYDYAGWTPAHLAAAANMPDVLRVLATTGLSDMDAAAVRTGSSPAGCEGWTPLHCAVAAGSREAVQVLLRDLHANPHTTCRSGLTPYDLIVVRGARRQQAAGGGVPAPGIRDEEGGVEAADESLLCPPLDDDVAVSLAEEFSRLLHPSTGNAEPSAQSKQPSTPGPSTPSPGAFSAAAQSASSSPLLQPQPGPPPLWPPPPLPTFPGGSCPPVNNRPVSPFARVFQRLEPASAPTGPGPSRPPGPSPPSPATPAPPALRPPALDASAAAVGTPVTPLPPPPPPLHTPAAHGSVPCSSGSPSESSGSRCLLVSPFNSPWGASTLNRAILCGADPLVQTLLRSLPQRTPTVSLVPLRGGGAAAWMAVVPAAAAGQHQRQVSEVQRPQQMAGSSEQRRAVVEDLGLHLGGTALSKAAAASMSLARLLGRVALDGSPLRPLGPLLGPEGQDRTGDGSSASVVSPAAPLKTLYGAGSHGSASTTLAASVPQTQLPTPQTAGRSQTLLLVPPAVQDLLVPSDDDGDGDTSGSDWRVYDTTAATRRTAAWLAVPTGGDPTRGWVSLELEVKLQPQVGVVPGSTVAAAGHLWVGARRATQAAVSSSGIPSDRIPGGEVASAGGSVSCSTDGVGGGSVGGGSLHGWSCGAEEGPPEGSVAADVVQGLVVTGAAGARSGGGGGGAGGGGGSGAAARREKALQLPPAGGRVGLLWEVFGGTLVAVVNGRSPVVVAHELPRSAAAPGPSAAPLAPAPDGSAASTSGPALAAGHSGRAPAQAELLVGVALPGCRLQLRSSGAGSGSSSRASGGGWAGGCGCVDDLLLAAEEARGRADAPWQSKPLMNSLHYASWVGNTRLLPQLVRDKGFSPNEPDGDGWTALHFAALAGQVETVRELLALGAHSDLYTNHGRTPCMLSAGSRLAPGGATALVDCLRLLAAHAVDSSGHSGTSAGSSSAAAAASPSSSCSVLAVRDERGRTLLMLAAESGNLEVVEWLLEEGLDLAARDADGRSAMQYGSQHDAVYRALERAWEGRAGDRSGGTSAAVRALGRAGKGDRVGGPKPSRVSDGTTGAGGGGRGMTAAAEGDGRGAWAVAPLRPWQWVVECSDVMWGKSLAEGGFGQVYEGTYRGSKVAIKRLKSGLTAREDAALERELSILQSLWPHDHVATFIGVVTADDGRRGLVMNRYSTSLQKMFRSMGKKLTPRIRYLIASQLAEALRFLHSLPNPIIHRDLKPDNVLLTEKLDVKLCDFGLSHVLAAGSDHVSSAGCYGHPYWMAPELLQGQPYDTKVDVWGWGVILYQLATWQDCNLYEGLNEHVVRYRCLFDGSIQLTEDLPPHLAPEVRDLLRDCLAPEPSCRPDMATCLERLAAVRDLPGPPADAVG